MPGEDAKKEKTSTKKCVFVSTIFMTTSNNQVWFRKKMQKSVALLDRTEPSSLQRIVRLKRTYWLVRSSNLKLTGDN